MERELYNNLIQWKKNHIKMPYMLVGARQTGKTYIIKEFCKKEFKNSIYINNFLRVNYSRKIRNKYNSLKLLYFNDF